MPEVALPGLIGTNPLGLFAALGVLDVAHRSGFAAGLHWTDEIEPRAVLSGVNDVETLTELAIADLQHWLRSPVLAWQSGGGQVTDLKVGQPELRAWMAAVLDEDDRSQADLMGALVAEGALAGKGESKPTHLHFTAGQQKFLLMVRTLAESVRSDDISVGLRGPWSRTSSLPVLGWEAGGDRVYALRGTDPSTDKKLGTPGADWLAFLGLAYFPVANRSGRLLTTGCSVEWKRGWLRWPLWTRSLSPDVVRSLLCDESVWRLDSAQLQARGVSRVLQAPIRRSDQGGYGSFGAAADQSGDVRESARRRGLRLGVRQPQRSTTLKSGE